VTAFSWVLGMLLWVIIVGHLVVYLTTKLTPRRFWRHAAHLRRTHRARRRITESDERFLAEEQIKWD
jgi:hypothetical protein